MLEIPVLKKVINNRLKCRKHYMDIVSFQFWLLVFNFNYTNVTKF